jgi:hypothetical protein
MNELEKESEKLNTVIDALLDGSLNRLNIVNFTSALYEYGLKMFNPSDYELGLKRIEENVQRFSEDFSKAIEQAKIMLNAHYQIAAKIENTRKSLPNNAKLDDPKPVIDFINKLHLEYYNFSQAEKVLGISRQTLTKYAKKKYLDYNTIRRGEREVISKKDIIIFFRNLYNINNQNSL